MRWVTWKKLIAFCCCFPEVQFLERFLEKSLSWKIRGLTDFKFLVGHDVERFSYLVGDNLEFEYVQWGQCMRFVNGEMIPDSVLKILTCSTAFYLDHHIKVCSLTEFGISNLNGLRLCIVRDCPKIETVIASKNPFEVVFPVLEHLSIYYLSNLGRIWEGTIPQGSFDNLRILTVHTCPKLQFVFASSMLQFFSNLEELIVEHCPAITEIIFQDHVVDSGSGTLPRLKTLKLHYLPELVNIMQGAWPPLENISIYNCPVLKKLGIDSNSSHTIKEIKAENDWWEKLEWQYASLHSLGALVGASLLQSSECGRSIKMHDLIRDLAVGILSLEGEGYQFLFRSYSKMAQHSDMGNSSSYRLLESFQSNRQSILHGRQFLLRAGVGLTEPPVKDEWEESKMMFLMDNKLSKLPERPSCLKLLALFLQRNHHLRVIPSLFFDLMPCLTVLNLSKTRIKSLPKSLFKLMSLEFLERFLEKSLSRKIRGLTDFKFVVGHDVKRFSYLIGDNLEFEYVQCGQCMGFVNGEMIPDAVLKILTCSTAFYLDHHIKVCSLTEFGISNLNGLRLCIVRDCPKIETLIASKNPFEVVFPVLEHLSIYYLSNLGRIWEGTIPQGSFDNLRILTVHTCPRLQFVFASSMLQFFSNLEELIVEHCPAITEIIFQDHVVDSGSGTLPRLKTLKLHYLPELVNIMQGAWPPLENISFYNCPVLKKLGIDSNSSHTIKEIKAENDWWEKLEWQDASLHSRLQAFFTSVSDNDL
ncbi:disease resistance protein rps2 [Quercus suber]|uniref:Disease resistance protein rps2 n=1 Tax=Quercus suber TaxID=58331 RepID=A0AAW0JCM6_QUESU